MVHADLVTPIARSRTLRRVSVYAILTGIYAVLPAVKEQLDRFAGYGDAPAEIHAALAVILGWLLVFRTNVAYGRWWEARTLWGQLVNASRNLAVKVTSLKNVTDADLRSARKLIISFAPLLRDHLRNEVQASRSEVLEPDQEHLPHAPSDIVQRLYLLTGRWKGAGVIDGHDLRIIDHDASRLLDICGGCERIRNTRTVRSYRIFARQCVFLFLITFPWGIADDFHWWTVPLTVITAYFMLGLEIVAEHVEEPFGYDDDDLDLDGLCITIATSVNQVFDRRPTQGTAAPPTISQEAG